jgi:hypothetical protein
MLRGLFKQAAEAAAEAVAEAAAEAATEAAAEAKAEVGFSTHIHIVYPNPNEKTKNHEMN